MAKKFLSAILAVAIAFTLTACNDNAVSPNASAGDKSPNTSADGKSPNTSADKGIFDVLPEIEVTDASAFTYKYDSSLEGMVITDYLKESPKIRIPDTLEGEPVVAVDLRNCEKQLTEIIMPDTAQMYYINDTIRGSLQYINCLKVSPKTYGLKDCKNLKAVYIPEGKTSIGNDAFNGCASLTSVTIPNGVTTIGANAFRGCTSLTTVNIPDSVTEICEFAFHSCTSLTNINIPDSVTAINRLPEDTPIYIDDIITWGEEPHEGAFYNCKNISVIYKDQTYNYNQLDELYNAINSN